MFKNFLERIYDLYGAYATYFAGNKMSIIHSGLKRDIQF